MPRKPAQRRSKRPVKKGPINDRLDREWSLIVRERNGHRCERCGRPATQVHHVISREFKRIRWDARNLVSSCFSCHDFAHKCSPLYNEWFAKTRPEDDAFIRERFNHRVITRSIPDLLDLLAEARAIRASLEDELAA